MAAKKKRPRLAPSAPRKRPRKPASAKRRKASSAGRGKAKRSKSGSNRSGAKGKPSKASTRGKAKADSVAKHKAAPKSKPKRKARKASKAKVQKRRVKKVPARKPKPKPKPRAPKKREDVALYWQGYFHDVFEAVKAQLPRTTGVALPVRIRTWRADDRADAVLSIDLSEAPGSAVDVQKALNDALLDYASQNGSYFISFGYSGSPQGKARHSKFGSPTLTQSGGTAETWPTTNLGGAIDTAEGSPRRPGVLKSVEKAMVVETLKVRFHWNPYGEQPERMA